MTDKIDTDSPPVKGPFTITYEYVALSDHMADNKAWTQAQATWDAEHEAVRFWGACHMYENTRPVDITPEPRWNRYTVDGRTPLTR